MVFFKDDIWKSISFFFFLQVFLSPDASRQSYLSRPAFCQDRLSLSVSRYFPTELPEDHLPWIWDTVYHSTQETVTITTIPKKNCLTNFTTVEMFLETFPNYARYLAGGLRSNILVPYERANSLKFDYIGNRNRSQGILNKQVYCNFYNDSRFTFRSLSAVVTVENGAMLADIGPVQIKCPNVMPMQSPVTGEALWDSVSIERSIEELSSPGIAFYANETVAVPVCNIPQASIRSENLNKSSHRAVYDYDLSICSTVFASSSAELVEWLEYHLLLGVDHFFLYNTASDSAQKQRLERQLDSYIRRKVVTLVSWPYMNCARNMETGRQLSFRTNCGPARSPLKLETFLPTSIAQSAATASCFARFKHLTRFMAHIDIDEFFLTRQPRSPDVLLQAGMLKMFVKQKFRRYPRAAVLAFSPVSMLRCEPSPFLKYSIFEGSRAASVPLSSWVDSKRSNATHTHFVFPRLGAYRDSEPGVRFEVKLITRSDAVEYVFTHFVPLFSSAAARAEDPIIVPSRQGVLLHYRKAGGIGGTAFYCADRNISLQMKIKTDMAQRCLNSIPMTLHRPLQQLLGDQVEHKHKMKKSLAGYSSKDRLDYIKLGFDDTFEQKLRANYKSSLSTVLLRT